MLLDPHGPIAFQEKNLLIISTLLMLLVIIPVFILTAVFAWKFRAGNTHANYIPNWDHNTVDEIIWWAVPAVIVAILGVFAWNTTHSLDPYRPLESSVAPISIQVVALDWKWLFIYPEQGIATVNYVQFPEDTPVNFSITSDAPMNSFWIPQLGGQIYAMAGMTTQLHLLADRVGEYAGVSANFSGSGFSGMKFVAKSTTKEDFDEWVHSVAQTSPPLSREVYRNLTTPTSYHPVAYYGSVESDLFASIIASYMHPDASLKTEYHQ